jgi:hypothetical protein
VTTQKSNLSELDRNITEKEAQELLNLSRQTLYRKRLSGELHYFQCGKKVLYSPKHIKDFLASCEE